MTHQADADHFNVSRIIISRLKVRLRQTCRTNGRLRNGRPRMTSQRQDMHLRLIHPQNRMITAADTAHRTPGLAGIRILGLVVHRRLRESLSNAIGP